MAGRAVMLDGGDVRLAAELDDAAVGRPWLVLLHGGGFTLRSWDGVLAALGGRFRTCAIDLPGHGGSDGLGADGSFEWGGRQVAAAMTDAGIGDALVIGWSLGWPIALCVEAVRDGVVGLVCVDGAVVHWTEEIGPFFDSPEQFLADVERRGDDDGVRRVVDNWEFDIPAQWARARCPVLYVLATRHPPEVVAMHRRGGQLRAEQHGATHVREIDASHAVPLDAPQALAQLIEDFADTSSSPAATHWGP